MAAAPPGADSQVLAEQTENASNFFGRCLERVFDGDKPHSSTSSDQVIQSRDSCTTPAAVPHEDPPKCQASHATMKRGSNEYETQFSKLIIPKRSRDSIPDKVFAELRAEFGTVQPLSNKSTSSTQERPTSCIATNKCPFCGDSMYAPSKKLRAMIQYWEHRARQGQILRPTDTLAVCQRHRDEQSVIPEGKLLGYPMDIDFRQLRRRVADPHRRYLGVLEDRITCPEHSAWFQAARQQREYMGKKASSSAHQIETFHDRQSGYYGEQGWELFNDILYSAFVHDPLMPSLDLTHEAVQQKIQPLDAHEFLGQVLLPELVCMLIQDDLGGEVHGVSYEDAQKVQRESRKFGIAMYASDTAFSAQNTRRSAGGWLNASPQRSKSGSPGRRKSRSPNARKSGSPGRPKESLVQYILPVRRSPRVSSTPGVYEESSDEEELRTQLWVTQSSRLPPTAQRVHATPLHQQRLFLSRTNSKGPRPAPRPARSANTPEKNT